MAASTQPTLAELTAQAQQLAAEVAANPTSAADKKTIVSTAKKLLAVVQATLPHINTAQGAFGGQEDAQNQATALINKLQKVIAAYS